MMLVSKLLDRFIQLKSKSWRKFYFQRQFNMAWREAVADRIAKRRNDAACTSKEANYAADEIARSGLYDLGMLLSPAQCKELQTYFATKLVDDPYRVHRKAVLPLSGQRDPMAHVLYHRHEDVVAAPYLLSLANAAAVLEPLHAYFGCRPTIGYMSAWWSYPTNASPQQAENFHRDVDDWRFIKLFVYLTDVGPETGPHVYIQGSARRPALSRIRRYSDEEVARAYGDEARIEKIGKAGTSFLENTYGLHKGTPIERGMRLMFQVVYSLNPLPYGPAFPVAQRNEFPDGAMLDPWINRVYLSQ